MSAFSQRDEVRALAYEILAEDCPCDNCEFVARCAAEELACKTFHRFVSVAGRGWKRETEPRAPTAEWFAKLSEVNGLRNGVDDTATPEFMERWVEAMHKDPRGVNETTGRYAVRIPITRTPRVRPTAKFADRTKSLPPSTPCTVQS